jgi:uncharacterized coiled-coil protein SlyX
MHVDENITELQILVMEQQQALEIMSQQLIDQSARFTELEKKLAVLESKLRLLAEQPGAGDSSTDERPPHY